MKKFLLILMALTMILSTLSVNVFAETTDNFVPSAEQEGDIDNPIEPNDTAPETGEAFPIVLVSVAGAFLTASVIFFIVAGKKDKEDKRS